MQNERLVVVVLMIAGFLWLRRRGRRMSDDARGKALLGAALFLVPMLLAGRWLFDRLPYGRYENLVIECVGIAVMIAVAGFAFLKPGRERAD
jgi:hypothetical protein